MRVKVHYGATRMVVPCQEAASMQVSTFIEEVLNPRLQRHLGDGTARVKELRTADGFYLYPSDCLAHVLESGEVVDALDYQTWLTETESLLERAYHRVGRTDYTLSHEPFLWVEVGLHKHKKLFVKLGKDKKTERLELFDAEELRTFGKAGRPLIARLEGHNEEEGEDWFMEASFIVNEDGLAQFIEIAVKAASDLRPQIERIEVGSNLAKKDVKVIQNVSCGAPGKEYILPEPTIEGPFFKTGEFTPSHEAPRFIELKMEKESVGEGDCPLDIKQKEASCADQTWWRDGQFSNLIFDHLALFNPSEKEVALVSIKSEYLDKDGQWKAPKETRLGQKSGYFSYSMGGYDTAGFNVAPNERLNLVVRTELEVHAPQFDRERRVHHSLPQPLHTRITFEDKDGNKKVIEMEQQNPPLVLQSKEAKLSSLSDRQTFQAWIEADDLEAEGRVWALVATEETYGTCVQVSGYDNFGKYLYKSDFERVLYKARKGKLTEVLLEEKVADNKGYSIAVTALVDLEHDYVYSLRFDLSTNTSRVTHHYLLPEFKPASA
ncbi:hypothetical protein QOT17_019615 [Balamuthia mandrillaris]